MPIPFRSPTFRSWKSGILAFILQQDCVANWSLVALLQVAEGYCETLAVTGTLIALALSPPAAFLLVYSQGIRTNASKAGNIIQTSKNDCGMWA